MNDDHHLERKTYDITGVLNQKDGQFIMAFLWGFLSEIEYLFLYDLTHGNYS